MTTFYTENGCVFVVDDDGNMSHNRTPIQQPPNDIHILRTVNRATIQGRLYVQSADIYELLAWLLKRTRNESLKITNFLIYKHKMQCLWMSAK